MAIFKPGSLIGGISGTVSGLNFANTRYGPIIRKALRRTDKHTQPQQGFRALFQDTQRYWATLTDAQRATWNAAASQIQFKNRLGIPRTLSGFQLFTKLNLEQYWPTPLVFIPPPVLTKISQPENVSLTASVAGQVVISFDQPDGTAASWTYFYGSRSRSSRPVHYFKNWRFLGKLKIDGPPWFEDITGLFVPTLGPLVEGELIAVKIGHLDESHLFSDYVQATTTTVA